METNIKKRLAALVAAGTFLATAGCDLKSHFEDEQIQESVYQDDEDIKYREYLKECEEFRKKYILEDYTENPFGPFNYFGISKSVIENMSGHDIFDKSEVYMGNGVLDFELLNRMYYDGEIIEKEKQYTTHWLDTSGVSFKDDVGHTMDVDKCIVFPLDNGVDIVMYSICGSQSYDVAIERRTNGASDYIRYLTFEPNENDEMILSEDRVIRLYRDGSGTSYQTIDNFNLVTLELPDGTKKEEWRKRGDIDLSYEGGKYTIYGPLNVYSLPERSYEIISNFDAENGLGKYKNTFIIVDEAAFDDIEGMMVTGDFEGVAMGFQRVITDEKEKSFLLEPQK